MRTSDKVSYVLPHLMTFHDHVMTFVMTDEDPWMTLATLGDSLLKILTTIVKTH
jgi:hypothetical protein